MCLQSFWKYFDWLLIRITFTFIPIFVYVTCFISKFVPINLLILFLCLQASEGCISRCKPLKYTYEKEIVMYAYFKRLNYFSTECVFAPNAYRGHARAFLKDLEKIRPSVIMDIIHSGKFLGWHILVGQFCLDNQETFVPNGLIIAKVFSIGLYHSRTLFPTPQLFYVYP